MFVICDYNKCTGCGMCSNICPKGSISMDEKLHGFIFPKIDENRCVNCEKCINFCPANKPKENESTVLKTFAAWNRKQSERRTSTSGGVFLALAEAVIKQGGTVVGVAWDEQFHPQHILCNRAEDLWQFRGSKYSQSNTGYVYRDVKKRLDANKIVLFSGAPCQVAALKSFLGIEYENLITVDLVCHGVPSNRLLDDYYQQFDSKISNVRLRYKDPYWDYSYVRIDFEDRKSYQKLTIQDDYFNLFNIGYILRESCHGCKYTSLNRKGDITLADFWGFKAHSFKTRNYNKGVSLILVNSLKGEKLVSAVSKKIYMEEADLELAVKGNKCLSQPFRLDKNKLEEFWSDYDSGMNIHELNQKYCAGTFEPLKHPVIRRLINKYRWVLKG